MTARGLHALTVDLEDWFHVCGLKRTPEIPHQSEWRVRAATERLLDLFAEHEVKVTFFVLGCVAEADPELIQKIADHGHEIASHGYSHSLIHDLTPAMFDEELARTEEVLINVSGCRPTGYRAPQWSAPAGAGWFDDILVQRGYSYDSSRIPLPLVGDASAPRHPYRIQTKHGLLWEAPPMVSTSYFGNLPVGGGWGFRFFPMRMITAAINGYVDANQPAILYLHPRDVDPDGPRLSLPLLKSFASYGSRSDAMPRLERLLEQFRFTTMKELVASWPPAC